MAENTSIEPAPITEQFSIVELVEVIRDYKKTVIAGMLGVIAAAVAIAFLMTPIYRAEVMFAQAEGGSSGGGLAAMSSQLGGLASMFGVSGLGGGRNSFYADLAILQSPSFITAFINDRNLLPTLFEKRWDAENEQWIVGEGEREPTALDGYNFMIDTGVLRLESEDRYSVGTLIIEWKDPAMAADWANDLIFRLNLRVREQAISEANKTIEYLNAELEKTSAVDLEKAIYYMIESQIQYRTMANVQEEFAFKVISPALVPSEDEFVRPNKRFIIALGLIGGLMFGIFLAFFSFGVSRIRAEISDRQSAR